MNPNKLSTIHQNVGLTENGDQLKAYVTVSGREVVTIQKNNGKNKISAVHYPTTGTIVVTQSQKK